MLLRQIYTIYERIMKAQQIIDAKVDEDLATINDENMLKRAQEFKKERFEVLLAGVLLAI